MLFIDIVSFSQKFQLYDTNELATYLDTYYDKVIPIIHRHGGEVEKIMGDGIIAVFGEPFLSADKSVLLKKAEDASLEILEKLENKEFKSKIALHSGEIMYYENNSINYKEYTIIGKTITELYRLESVSEDNALNYYVSSDYDKFIDFRNKNMNNSSFYDYQRAKWQVSSNKFKINLKGVEYEHMKYISKNKISYK